MPEPSDQEFSAPPLADVEPPSASTPAGGVIGQVQAVTLEFIHEVRDRPAAALPAILLPIAFVAFRLRERRNGEDEFGIEGDGSGDEDES